jgi:hypothetical protein
MTPPPTFSPEPGAEIVCPFCASTETEFFAMFGQFLLSSQYYCRSCKTVFDVVRWEEPDRIAPTEKSQTYFSDGRSSHRE